MLHCPSEVKKTNNNEFETFLKSLDLEDVYEYKSFSKKLYREYILVCELRDNYSDLFLNNIEKEFGLILAHAEFLKSNIRKSNLKFSQKSAQIVEIDKKVEEKLESIEDGLYEKINHKGEVVGSLRVSHGMVVTNTTHEFDGKTVISKIEFELLKDNLSYYSWRKSLITS